LPPEIGGVFYSHYFVNTLVPYRVATKKRILPLDPPSGGFALVVTLSLMVLLMVLGTGLLSLSALALRSSSHGAAQAEARANARLALLLAIGELQKELGPDRRISARAEILDKDPGTGEMDEVANPHYLGVWESWDTWLTDRKDSLSIQDTYKRGRDPSLFRGWLVSHPDAEKYETAPGSAPTDDMIVMCGEASAGPEPANHVRAGRVSVRSGNRSTGSYAWWISDESQKARLDLKPRDDADTIASAQIIASHTGRPGIETMSKMSDFDTTPKSLDKMVTTGQARLSAAEAAEHFHDLTAHSLGLLTDVRSGGFKSDLNLAFESDVVPEEMDQAELFSGRPFDAPIRPMTGELEGIVPQNPYVAPMSWRQMREFYRLYREFPGSGIMQPVEWNRGKPVTRRFIMARRPYHWDVGGYARQLVMLRQTWIIATSSERSRATPGGIDYYVLAIPILYLWNPYNIAMKVEAKEIASLGSMYYAVGMRQKTYRGTTMVSESPFPDENLPGNPRANSDLTGNQMGYRMIPTGRRSSSPIEFQPGEVRVFSTDTQIVRQSGGPASSEAMLNRFFYASPGYSPVQDTGTLRGLKYRVNPGSGRGTLSLSLRLADARHCDNRYFGASRHAGLVWSFHEVLSANHGAFDENGNLVTKQWASEWHDVAYMGATSVDWVTPRELDGAWIVRDDPAYRARWGAPGSPPMPVGIFSVVAKSAEQLAYDSSAGFAGDFRNRSWLHAPPTRLANFLMNPVGLNRADSPYQLHFRPVNGDQEVSEYLQADGPNGFFGGGYTPARGQTHLTAHSLPTAPITNLGSFAGIRMDHARAWIVQGEDNFSSPSVDTSLAPGWYAGRGYYNIKHMAHAGAAFGAGIGNAYAHPMIEPEEVYTRHDFGEDLGWQDPNPSAATKLPVCDDYWDHLFLANEELWDSWFCSGIAPVVSNGRVTTPKKTVAEDFFSGKPTQLSRHFQPNLRGSTPGELADLVEVTGASPGTNGWDLIGSNILNRGQFNVNSTSKEAWKALLMSLSDRPIACNDVSSGPAVIPRDPDRVSLSRHPLANSKAAASGPLDEHAWRGIRSLSEEEIDKLAVEIVRQVKLRGPFLNMAEFINRRLSTDTTGVSGALQAAIDWDEFNAGYSGATSGSGESVNKAYKGSDGMIDESQLPARYPNTKAAAGSLYAGIPGYVMQSDLLQGISASLSVRGDTFLVRACGESLSPGGKVAATAWCEAVVQRTPEYVDPADAADKKMRRAGQLPDATPDLKPLNQAFGRRFKVISFRWLGKDEI